MNFELVSNFELGASSFSAPGRLAVLGPGLLGGSVLLAARARLPGSELVAWSRDGTERRLVRARGLAAVVTADLAAAVRGADLVVLCTPPAAMAAMAREFAPHLAPGALVTDVSSVKTPVVTALGPLLGARFVSAHPMAGSERGGLAAARGDLFAGAVCLLTPGEQADPEAVARVGEFWKALGCREIRTLSPAAHDTAVALVSHLPHLLAAALLTLPDAAALACSGPGLRDVTRPAGGPAELWTEILSLNREPVTNALRAMTDLLRDLATRLEPGREADLTGFLRAAANRRAALVPPPPGKPA